MNVYFAQSKERPCTYIISKTEIGHIKKIVKLRSIESLLLEQDGNNAFIPRASNTKEGRHGHVKVLSRRVAPSALVVWWAEVGGCNGDPSPAKAPLWVCFIVTHNLVTGPTCLPISEQNTAQCCCMYSKTSMDSVVIPTSSP